MIPKNTFILIVLTLLLASCGSRTKIEAIKLATGAVESTVTTINSGTVEAQNQAELAFGTVGRIMATDTTGAGIAAGDGI